jgi:hypothetical protein
LKKELRRNRKRKHFKSFICIFQTNKKYDRRSTLYFSSFIALLTMKNETFIFIFEPFFFSSLLHNLILTSDKIQFKKKYIFKSRNSHEAWGKRRQRHKQHGRSTFIQNHFFCQLISFLLRRAHSIMNFMMLWCFCKLLGSHDFFHIISIFSFSLTTNFSQVMELFS